MYNIQTMTFTTPEVLISYKVALEVNSFGIKNYLRLAQVVIVDHISVILATMAKPSELSEYLY